MISQSANKGTQCFCKLGPPAYQACMMDLGCPCMICSYVVVAYKACEHQRSPTFKPKAPTNIQTLPCHLPAGKSGKHMEALWIFPWSIRYKYIYIYICNSLSDLRKRFRTAQNDESSKGPKPFLKAVVFCKPPGLESLGCQKHVNHCCIHLGSQVVS